MQQIAVGAAGAAGRGEENRQRGHVYLIVMACGEMKDGEKDPLHVMEVEVEAEVIGDLLDLSG